MYVCEREREREEEREALPMTRGADGLIGKIKAGNSKQLKNNVIVYIKYDVVLYRQMILK